MKSTFPPNASPFSTIDKLLVSEINRQLNTHFAKNTHFLFPFVEQNIIQNGESCKCLALVNAFLISFFHREQNLLNIFWQKRERQKDKWKLISGRRRWKREWSEGPGLSPLQKLPLLIMLSLSLSTPYIKTTTSTQVSYKNNFTKKYIFLFLFFSLLFLLFR